MDSRLEFLLRYAEVKPDFTYSAIMRFLNKYYPEKIFPFMENFKEGFDRGCAEELEDPISPALLETCEKLGINYKQANYNDLLIKLAGKIDDLKKKFPNIEIDELAKNDPSGNHKYLLWMAQQREKGHKLEDIIPTVQLFHQKHKQLENKDIYSYKDLKDLESILKNLGESKTKQREISKSGGAVIYEDPEFLVIRPDTKESCIFYGKNTKWCITMSEANYYESYTQNNVIFYFILRKQQKQDGLDKIALAYQRGIKNEILQLDVFDEKDNQIQLPSELQNIEKLCEQDAISRPKSVIAKIKDGDATLEETQDYLGANKDNEESLYLLARDTTHPEILAQLIKYPNLRKNITNNPSTPLEILEELSKDNNWEVRAGVAKNKFNISPQILTHLSNDLSVNVVAEVAVNPNTPPEILDKLSASNILEIRMEVARNPSTPIEILIRLLNDSNKIVQFQAKLTFEKFHDKSSVAYKINLVQSAPVGSKILSEYMNDWLTTVREIVAEKISIEYLPHMMKDPNYSVRAKVARRIPLEYLPQMANDENAHVQFIVKQRLRKEHGG